MATARYSHATQPHAVAANAQRPKYREPLEETLPSNIMFDRRVVRGNTYAAVHLNQNQNTQYDSFMEHGTKRRNTKRSANKPHTDDNGVQPVPGRVHADIQTDQYLEEITDRAIEVDVDVQTDAFLEQVQVPTFIPEKSGVDVETQIEDGDLFDFDFEVEPILDVLVGKPLEQAMMEVLEEEELEAMRVHQEHFEQIRNAELAETQRLEEAERRRMEEKERRLQQERERLAREEDVRQKVVARTFAKGFLSELQNSVFSNLSEAGYFVDPVEDEVSREFVPWLHDAVEMNLDRMRVARALADDVIAAAAQRRSIEEAEMLRIYEEAARAELEAQEAEAAAADAAARLTAASQSAEKSAEEGDDAKNEADGKDSPIEAESEAELKEE